MVKNLRLVKKIRKEKPPNPSAEPPKEEELLAWLRLIRTPSIGPHTFYQLISHFGSALTALEELPRYFKRSNANPLIICPQATVEKEYQYHSQNGARLLIAIDPLYPELLRTLPDAPPVISVKGRLEILNALTLAIVGARNASFHGKRFAEQLARRLGEQGWVIASGMARGIDASAHQGALATGAIAVLAGGLNIIYPPENEGLYNNIVEHGVIMSEMPWDTQPSATLFPKRNRLIAGLSRGIIVIEAAERSGSLITARYALEQGREVFAVPGSPLDPRCHGSNRLIQEGATLIQTTDDILNAFPSLATASPSPTPSSPPNSQGGLFFDKIDLESIHGNILENLSPTPIKLDELIRACQLPPPVVLRALTELELAGKIHRLSTNHIVRSPITCI